MPHASVHWRGSRKGPRIGLIFGLCGAIGVRPILHRQSSTESGKQLSAQIKLDGRDHAHFLKGRV